MDNIYNEVHAVEDSDKFNPEHISNYLCSLRDRLKQTVQQHNDMIQISMNLIKEIGDVPTMMELLQSDSSLNRNKIKRLIMEFESIQDSSRGLTSNDMVDLNAQFAQFRALNESQLLRDSLMCFKRAKDSFEQVESLLNKVGERDKAHASPQLSLLSIGSQGASRCLRDKIQAFNTGSDRTQDASQHFSSCFCTASSTHIPSKEETKQPELGAQSRTNSGYEGDVDSEMDQAKVADS